MKENKKIFKGISFWEDFNEPIPVKPVIEVQYTIEELERDLNRIEESLKFNDIQKVNLLQLYDQKMAEITKYQSQHPKQIIEEKGNKLRITCTELDERTLKIEINNLLPHIKKALNIKHYQELRDYYIPTLNKAISQSNTNIQLDKAFVFILQKFPTMHIRDLDNRYKTFIFDSLRYSKIITDDGYMNLSYYEKGVYEKGVTKTEIYLTDEKYTLDLMMKTM